MEGRAFPLFNELLSLTFLTRYFRLPLPDKSLAIRQTKLLIRFWPWHWLGCKSPCRQEAPKFPDSTGSWRFFRP